jgi:hypothetical protein
MLYSMFTLLLRMALAAAAMMLLKLVSKKLG